MSELPAGGAPELHLWSSLYRDVARNAGPTGSQRSILSYDVPTGRTGVYRLFAFAKARTTGGEAKLTILENGQEWQVIKRAAFGGATVDVKPSSGTRPFTYQTAPVPGGIVGTYLVGLDPKGLILAVDDDGGAGKASRLTGVAGIGRVVVASDGAGKGATTLYANDVFDDRDHDGLGYGLERELQTCDLRGTTAFCRGVHKLQDSDRDGLVDVAEVFGLEGNPPTELSRWGASPAHKDVFVEVDYTTLYPQMPMTEADAEAIRESSLTAGSRSSPSPMACSTWTSRPAPTFR
jgi:hypothetical protein